MRKDPAILVLRMMAVFVCAAMLIGYEWGGIFKDPVLNTVAVTQIGCLLFVAFFPALAARTLLGKVALGIGFVLFLGASLAMAFKLDLTAGEWDVASLRIAFVVLYGALALRLLRAA